MRFSDFFPILLFAVVALTGCKKPLVSGPVDTALMQTEGIARALASDDFDGAKREAQRLLTFLEKYEEAPKQLLPGAQSVLESGDIEQARDGFTELSKQAVPLAEGNPVFRIIHCPMTRQGYGKWVQIGREITNPYFGAAMLNCGTVEQ